MSLMNELNQAASLLFDFSAQGYTNHEEHVAATVGMSSHLLAVLVVARVKVSAPFAPAQPSSGQGSRIRGAACNAPIWC
jgi:hypothetical protein